MIDLVFQEGAGDHSRVSAERAKAHGILLGGACSRGDSFRAAEGTWTPPRRQLRIGLRPAARFIRGKLFVSLIAYNFGAAQRRRLGFYRCVSALKFVPTERRAGCLGIQERFSIARAGADAGAQTSVPGNQPPRSSYTFLSQPPSVSRQYLRRCFRNPDHADCLADRDPQRLFTGRGEGRSS